MVEDHQIVLVGQVIAEGNRLIPVVAQMRIGTRRPVAHVGDLRIQLMKTELRQQVARVGANHGGHNIPTEEDPQGEQRQSPSQRLSQSRLRVTHLLSLYHCTLPSHHLLLVPCRHHTRRQRVLDQVDLHSLQHQRVPDQVDLHSPHGGKDRRKLKEENLSTLRT